MFGESLFNLGANNFGYWVNGRNEDDCETHFGMRIMTMIVYNSENQIMSDCCDDICSVANNGEKWWREKKNNEL